MGGSLRPNQWLTALHIGTLICSVFSRNNIPDEAVLSFGQQWALATNGSTDTALDFMLAYIFL
jgi:hypothetical protein